MANFADASFESVLEINFSPFFYFNTIIIQNASLIFDIITFFQIIQIHNSLNNKVFLMNEHQQQA